MVKRSADGQFTQENWDSEEPEREPEVGEFNRASEDVLARRKILVARRRMPERKKEPEVNPFANFKGFKGLSFSAGSLALGKPSNAACSGSTGEATKSTGSDEASTAETAFRLKSSTKIADTSGRTAAEETDKGSFLSSDMSGSKAKRRLTDKKEVPSLIEKHYEPIRVSDIGVELLTNIKALNKEFMQHLTKYFQQNPFVNFKPTFDDYIAHMDRLQRENGITEDAALWKIPNEPTRKGSTSAALFQFRQPSSETTRAEKMTQEASDKSSKAATPSAFKQPSETTDAEKLTKEAGDKSPAAPTSFQFKQPPSEAVRTGDLTEVSTPVDSSSAAKEQVEETLPEDKQEDDSAQPKPIQSFFKFPKPTIVVPSSDDGAKESGSCTTPMGNKSAPSDNQGIALQSRPLFRFGLQKSDGSGGKMSFLPPATSQGLFNFGVQQPSPFGESLFPSSTAPAAENDSREGEEEEESVPPVVTLEIPPEEGSIHDVRCKLYYLDEKKKYNEHGIGQLYIKPLGNGRVQLIIRADNSLRNILLNAAIDKSTPLTKAGKNGLSVVVVPNPPINKEAPDQPTVALLRLKTDDQLTKLWEKVEEAKEKVCALHIHCFHLKSAIKEFLYCEGKISPAMLKARAPKPGHVLISTRHLCVALFGPAYELSIMTSGAKNSEGFTHLNVNHSVNPVGLVPRANTQRVESLWAQAKRQNKFQCGTHRSMLGCCICDFMWRQWLGPGEDLFEKILQDSFRPPE